MGEANQVYKKNMQIYRTNMLFIYVCNWETLIIKTVINKKLKVTESNINGNILYEPKELVRIYVCEIVKIVTN